MHWDERDPENLHWSILISCHACGHDKFTPKASIKSRPWHGYCPDCVHESEEPRTLNRRTLAGQHLNPFGAKIDYDAPHGYNRALVYCPNYSACRGTSQKRVDASNQDKQPFYCKKCLSENRRSKLAAAWQAAKGGGDGQKNAERTSAGRPSVASKRTAKVVDAIAVKFERVTAEGLFGDAQLTAMNRQTLSPYIDDIKHYTESYTGAELQRRLDDWFAFCRLKEIFPDASRPFRPFVKTVVDQLRAGVKKEKIILELESRRQGQKLCRARKSRINTGLRS